MLLYKKIPHLKILLPHMFGKYFAKQIWISFFKCRISQSLKCFCTWVISNRRRDMQCLLGPCKHSPFLISQDRCSIAVHLWETHGILGHISSSRMQLMTNVDILVGSLTTLYQEGYIQCETLYFKRATSIMKITEIKSSEELRIIKLENRISVSKGLTGSHLGQVQIGLVTTEIKMKPMVRSQSIQLSRKIFLAKKKRVI